MAERTSRSGKKVVQAESAPAPATTAKERAAIKAEADRRVREGEGWQATPEAKSGATVKRVIAWILWIIALGLEGYAIWFLLTDQPRPTWFLWAAIGLLVVIGALAIIGGQLWKAANHADPASRQEPFRFFVQNQLGAFIPVLAFAPFIVVLLLNKNVDAKTKGILGAVAGVLLVGGVAANIDYAPVSQEGNTEEQIEEEIANEGQIDEYSAIVAELTGTDEVTWTQSGDVYHLCTDASAVNQESEDGRIFTGTVADAHAAGKEGLTLQVEQELGQCALPEPENLDDIEAEIRQLREQFEAENAG